MPESRSGEDAMRRPIDGRREEVDEEDIAVVFIANPDDEDAALADAIAVAAPQQ